MRMLGRLILATVNVNLQNNLQKMALKIHSVSKGWMNPCQYVDSHDLILITPDITKSPVFTKHCLGST